MTFFKAVSLGLVTATLVFRTRCASAESVARFSNGLVAGDGGTMLPFFYNVMFRPGVPVENLAKHPSSRTRSAPGGHEPFEISTLTAEASDEMVRGVPVPVSTAAFETTGSGTSEIEIDLPLLVGFDGEVLGSQSLAAAQFTADTMNSYAPGAGVLSLDVIVPPGAFVESSPVPLPPASWGGLALLGVYGLTKLRRRNGGPPAA